MDLTTLISQFSNVTPALPYLTAIVAVCAAIATVLPPPDAGSKSIYAAIYTAVNWIALNLGHAKNVPPPAAPTAPTAPTTTTGA